MMLPCSTGQWKDELEYIIQDAPKWIREGVRGAVTTEKEYGLFASDCLNGMDAFFAYANARERKDTLVI